MSDGHGNTRGAGLRVALICAALLPLAGCGSDEPTKPDSVSTEAERGPFHFTVTARPPEVLFGDAVTIELLGRTPEGQIVEFPDPNDLGDFDVLSSETSEPRPGAEKGLEWRRTYGVEPRVAGTVEIPPLLMKYGKRPDDSAARPVMDKELASGTLKIEVRSLLADSNDPETPRDITGTLMPPKPPDPWFWPLVVGIPLAALLVLGLLGWLVMRRVRQPAPPPAPDVVALRALNALAMEQLVESGRGREFYFRLSEIVRVYIEGRFLIAAPEMTTEEFLSTLARGGTQLSSEHVGRLRPFLEACDFVKYAALAPDADASVQALGTARNFVQTTAGPVAADESTRGGQAA